MLGARLVALGALVASTPWAADAPRGVHPADGSVHDEGALARDVAILQRAWSTEAEVGRLEPRLLERGDKRPVFLPSPALDEKTESCATVAVVGARNISFVLLFGVEDSSAGRRAWPVPSSAGVAEVTRCGARKSLLENLVVQMRSPRGLLEYLVVVSKDPPTPVAEVVPGRDPGPSLPSPSVGPRPLLPPLAERVTRLEASARREGARSVRNTSVGADRSGRGDLALTLEVGCHRLDVLGQPGNDGEVDVDAELRTLSGDEALVGDGSENGQATLEWCVGAATRARLVFGGAAAEREVGVVHASFELPDALPAEWGPVARGRLAMALGPRLRSALASPPVYTSLGVQGATLLPVSVEPGACYVVAASSIRGALANLALGVESGAMRRENNAASSWQGTALSFCNDDGDVATVEVQATGTGLAWLLGAWQVARLSGRSEK